MTDITATVREAHHHVRLNLTGAPPLTNLMGHASTPIGLRIEYTRSPGIDRTDITIEYKDSARTLLPVEDVPGWLRELVEKHRPTWTID